MIRFFLIALVAAFLCGCAGSQQLPAGLPADAGQPAALQAQTGIVDDPGMLAVSGEARHSGGLFNVEDPAAGMPMPGEEPVAGLDFAANRLVVVWEEQPDPVVQQRYMGGGPAADLKRATDNHPLVDHPFYRRVSHNLAQQYGLSEFGRVFYKGLNFTSYELANVTDVSQLDSMMQRILDENRGLVREVTYDYYYEACSPEQPGSVLLDSAAATEQAISSLPWRRPEANRSASAPPDDPMHINVDGPSGGTWANWRVGAVDGQAWDYTTGSNQIVVAVVDTGTRYTHEDLVDNCIEPAAEYPYNEPGILTDVVNKDNDPNDDHNHGTWCAGNVGATGNNGLGLAGINHTVRILPVKVLSAGGGGSETQVAEGMLLADYLGANIVSMSLGGSYPGRIMQLAAQQLDEDGRLLVVAAGNTNDSAPFYPGFYPYALGVGATTLVNVDDNEDFSVNGDGVIPTEERFDARAGFSNYGEWVDIAAPGVRVRSTDKASDSAYRASVAGTSFACPYTAGCAALLWSYMGPEATHTEVRGMLMSSATVMEHVNKGASPDGFIDDTTNGPVRFVNVWEALKLYEGGPYEAPLVSWHSPLPGDVVSGMVDLQLSVEGGSGNVLKVEFDTPTRHLGTIYEEMDGYWQLAWDSRFDFNRQLEITAKLYDDVGNIIALPLNITPDNARIVPGWQEGFDGTPNDEIPEGWFRADYNGDPASTQWGADDSQFVTAAPAMRSNGTAATYAPNSNDWLFAPVVDLTGFASATLTFQRRYIRGTGDAFLFFATSDDEQYSGASFTSGGLQDWAEFSYNLDGFCGGEVRLMWQLTANGGGQDAGMWIDDIEITVPGGTPPTITINSPLDNAQASGMTDIEVTVSDDTVAIELLADPVNRGSILYEDIPDNDPENPTKTFTASWDSRHTGTGSCLLRMRAYDDEGDDGGLNDLAAEDSIWLQVANEVVGSGWLEDFEDVSELGGISDGLFDGAWYRWGDDEVRWRTGAHNPWRGLAHAYLGPEGGGEYGNNELDWLYSPVIDLSSALAPRLRLLHSLDVEDGIGDKAVLYMVRYDGLQELQLNLLELRSDSGGYVPLALNLQELAAQPFRLLFKFDSNGNSLAGEGWCIDDIELVDASPAIFSVYRPRAYPGQTVKVTGHNFGHLQSGSIVTFEKLGGGRTEAVVASWSMDLLQVAVPLDATSGDVIVNVMGNDSNTRHFSVLLDPTELVEIGQF